MSYISEFKKWSWSFIWISLAVTFVDFNMLMSLWFLNLNPKNTFIENVELFRPCAFPFLWVFLFTNDFWCLKPFLLQILISTLLFFFCLLVYMLLLFFLFLFLLNAFFNCEKFIFLCFYLCFVLVWFFAVLGIELGPSYSPAHFYLFCDSLTKLPRLGWNLRSSYVSLPECGNCRCAPPCLA